MSPRSARLLVGLVLVAAGGSGAGCGDDAELTRPGVGGAAGAGGTPEGCVDIRVDGNLLPDAADWWVNPTEMARQPFWLTEQSIQVAWILERLDVPTTHLFVSSFDRISGALIETRVYDAFPPETGPRSTSIWDAAGSADGSFAALLVHDGNGNASGGNVERIAVGHAAEPTLRATVDLPWGESEANGMHVGWDGEAFAVHALNEVGNAVRMVRLGTDGSVVTPETEVGVVTSAFWEDTSMFRTDADTGITWMVTIEQGGVWLTGHYRDGTPLGGTQAEGGVVITPQGQAPDGTPGYDPAVGPRGDGALLSWDVGSGEDAYLQCVEGTVPQGDALVLPGVLGPRAIAALPQGWWMAAKTRAGVEQIASMDGELVSFRPLVPQPPCWPDCPKDFDVRSLSAVRFGDEHWLGFWDHTDCCSTDDEHPSAARPYRIVRIEEGCVYRTMYEINNPE